MGFDLHGINPKNNTIKKPEDGAPDNYGELWAKDYEAWQDQDGAYFRNNVWWWRPLADYIIEHTKCVSEEDAKHWHFNDGHKVSEEEANAIADQLEHLIKTGHTETFAHDYEQQRKECEEHNKKVDALHKKLKEKVERETGKTNIAPCDYPKADHEEWNRIYRMTKHTASYPFSMDNVREFIKFCRNSGGFEIC